MVNATSSTAGTPLLSALLQGGGTLAATATGPAPGFDSKVADFSALLDQAGNAAPTAATPPVELQAVQLALSAGTAPASPGKHAGKILPLAANALPDLPILPDAANPHAISTALALPNAERREIDQPLAADQLPDAVLPDAVLPGVVLPNLVSADAAAPNAALPMPLFAQNLIAPAVQPGSTAANHPDDSNAGYSVGRPAVQSTTATGLVRTLPSISARSFLNQTEAPIGPGTAPLDPGVAAVQLDPVELVRVVPYSASPVPVPHAPITKLEFQTAAAAPFAPPATTIHSKFALAAVQTEEPAALVASPLDPGVTAVRLDPVELVRAAPSLSSQARVQQALAATLEQPSTATIDKFALVPATVAQPRVSTTADIPSVEAAQAAVPASRFGEGKLADDLDTRASAALEAARTPIPVVMTEVRAAISPGDGIATVPAGTPAEPAHDFASLVDRLVEAREAGAGHIVRTALRHAEFGSVAMQLRQDDGMTSVTFSSSDPAFAPAIQAAAASAMSAQAGDDHRRDQQTRQDQQSPAQNQQQSAANQTGSGSGTQQGQQQLAQSRADAETRSNSRGGSASLSSQENGREQGPDKPGRGSGIYA